MLINTSDHNNQHHPHHNSASTVGATISPASASGLSSVGSGSGRGQNQSLPPPSPPTAVRIGGGNGNVGSESNGNGSQVEILLAQMHQLFGQADEFKIGLETFTHPAAGRLQNVYTELRAELLEKRLEQLFEGERDCQYQLDAARLRLQTAQERTDAFLVTTKKLQSELTERLHDLSERQERLKDTMRQTLTDDAGEGDEETSADMAA